MSSQTILWVSLIVFFSAMIQQNCPADDAPLPSITVSGTAEVRVVPDQAVLTFSIESRESTLDLAVNDNDSRIGAVSEFLQASKIESKNIRTQVITIRPIFEARNPGPWKNQAAQQMAIPNSAPLPAANDKPDLIKPVGYTARRGMSVTLTDLSTFDAVYRGLIERGVNEVGGVEFRTTELRKHRDEARLKAIRAAKEKAAAMAKELGARLAAVQTITEETGSRYSNFIQNSFSAVVAENDSEGSLAAGMIEITASVRVVFRLGDVEFKSDVDATK